MKETFSFQVMINLVSRKVSEYLDRFSEQYMFLVSSDVFFSDKTYLLHFGLLLCESMDKDAIDKEAFYELLSNMCGFTNPEDVKKLAKSSRRYYDDLNSFFINLSKGLSEYLKNYIGEFEPECIETVADNYCKNFLDNLYKEMGGVRDIRCCIVEDPDTCYYQNFEDVCYYDPDPNFDSD